MADDLGDHLMRQHGVVSRWVDETPAYDQAKWHALDHATFPDREFEPHSHLTTVAEIFAIDRSLGHTPVVQAGSGVCVCGDLVTSEVHNA